MNEKFKGKLTTNQTYVMLSTKKNKHIFHGCLERSIAISSQSPSFIDIATHYDWLLLLLFFALFFPFFFSHPPPFFLCLKLICYLDSNSKKSDLVVSLIDNIETSLMYKLIPT